MMCNKEEEEALAYRLAKAAGSNCFDFGNYEDFEDRQEFRLMACGMLNHKG